jgi:hypothetical protein
MINTVRNTVLSILNKNNYGYLSPSDFNLFAKQAQLDVFESYFIRYNYLINKENARKSGVDYADLKKEIEESIDRFSETKPLYLDSKNVYQLPSPLTTGSDYYLLNKALVKTEMVTDGITDGLVGTFDQVVDSTADFILDGVSIGDLVAVELGGVKFAEVLSVTTTTITVDLALFTAAGIKYAVYIDKVKMKELEKVTHGKINMLNNSLLTSPTIMFPAYTQEQSSLTAYPDTIKSIGRVIAQYIRYPKEPRWTYLSLLGGEPVFSASQPDYQDFEVPLEDEVHLIIKICQYAGISIREPEVYQFSQAEEVEKKQEKL